LSSTLYVAPCGKAKVWDSDPSRGPTPAGEAYTGTFAGAAAKYARASGAPWIILSAKYGFLRPTDLVPGPYDTTFLKPSADTVQVATLREQIASLDLGQFSFVVVLGGSAYAKRVKDAFAGSAATVRTPLAGLGGMGHMISRLVRAREQHEAL
jgi:hypothetical protein